MKRLVAGIFGLLLFWATAHNAGDAAEAESWSAKWIWTPGKEDDYNQWMLARRDVEVRGAVRQARLRVTADTRYQLYINGRFASDGPVKAFPSHYRYDPVEVARFLLPGRNVIAVRVHHWGRDTAQSIAVQPGLLVQLDWEDETGAHTLGTDRAWRVCRDRAHNARSPIVSAHLGFEEQYDARLEPRGWLTAEFAPDPSWTAAAEIAPAQHGPWKDLKVCEIPQLAKEPVAPLAVLGVERVRTPRIASTLNLGRCQGLERKAEALGTHRFVLATVIESSADQEATVMRPSAGLEFGLLRFPDADVDVRRDLLTAERAAVRLHRGPNPLIVVLDGKAEIEEFQFTLDAEQGVSLRNPFGPGPWAVAGPFPPGDKLFAKLRAARSPADLERSRERFRAVEAREVSPCDVHALTCFRQSLGTVQIPEAAAMLADNEESTVLPPSKEDLELMIDLGREYNAHIGVELRAKAGTVLDGNVFERFHEGSPQWSWRNRSSFRYIARDGWQSYLTMRHFGGRYLALTVRAHEAEVLIRRVFAVATHYPISETGRFHCSDALLNNVWTVCGNTMRACMEDTFVDCPLYEQSLWLGDARNESLVCCRMFGDARLVRRCCLLGAESLENGDLAHMRVPTRWPRIIPAWSFLWARMCWEHYEYTGDRQTLVEETYPAVRQMLDNCLNKYIDAQTGLFSIQAWQFFDWIGLDNGHRIVTHNNTFLVDALRLGARMAQVAGDAAAAARFQTATEKLMARINEHLWNETRGAYVDSIHNNGVRSEKLSRQINTLALLHGVVPAARQARVLPIVLGERTAEIVQFGSPFATLYLLEWLGETGRIGPMLDVIRQLWGGMLDGQTTTFWESFANGNLGGGRYPTRSYCHAWSAGPAYTLSRYVLGVRIDKPGGARVSVAPQLDCLERAAGVVLLPGGAVRLEWQRSGPREARLNVTLEGDVRARLLLPAGWKPADAAPAHGELTPHRAHLFQVKK